MLLYCLSVRVADSLNLVWIGLMTRVIGYAASETKARDIWTDDHEVFKLDTTENLTYAVYLRLIDRKLIPIRDNWAFFDRCYSWCARSEYRLEAGVFNGVGQFGTKFQAEGDLRPHQPFFVSEK